MVFATLQHRENLAAMFGLPDGVELHAKPYRARDTDDVHAMLTCGTAADHVSRVVTLSNPGAAAGPRAIEEWVGEQLLDLVREYREPLRVLRTNALEQLRAAADAGATCWPE